MKIQILIKRYTQGLVNSIENETEFSALLRELSDFSGLLKNKELKDTLANPFLPITKKTQITEAVLEKKSLSLKASRFILLLVEKSRLELLPDILKSLPEAWNEKRGVYTFEVTSAVPLTNIQKEKLEKKLESIEKRPVALKYRINPELIGGLCIGRGNIIYDVSIKGSLMRLKEKICES